MIFTLRRTALVLLLTFTAGCGSLYFHPEQGLRENLPAMLLAPEDVHFSAADGVHLHGWLFRAREPKGSVLVLHGNAENLSTHVNSVLWLVLEGFNVFIIDYRGYGRSEGSPSVSGIHLDATAALRTLIGLRGIDRERIAVLGQSIGGAAAVYTAATSPDRPHIRALIIDSAFASYRGIVREKLGQFFLTWPLQYPLSWLFPGESYSPVRWIAKVSPIPVLILHGQDDVVVPLHHGHMLFQASREPRTFLQTAPVGHVRAFADGNVRRTVAAYLEQAFGGTRVAQGHRVFPADADVPWLTNAGK